MATAAAVVPAIDVEETIRTRAYALFEERGRWDGAALDDWLRAESEVLAQYGVKKSA
jgi:hypothetical protein